MSHGSNINFVESASNRLEHLPGSFLRRLWVDQKHLRTRGGRLRILEGLLRSPRPRCRSGCREIAASLFGLLRLVWAKTP